MASPVEVGPFVDEGTDDVRYRSCEFCHHTAVYDIWAGKHLEADWRKFYLLSDGLSVCGDCLPTIGKDELAG